MNFLNRYFFAGIVLLFTVNFYSQDIPELKTDRPDKTESSSVVPSGWFQIETGFEYLKEKYDDDSELSSYNIGSTLFRYGIIEKLELRFAGGFLSEQFTASNQDSSSEGIAGLMAGGKFELVSGQESVPDIAILLHAFLPFGSEEYNPGKIEPQAIISVAYALNDFLDLGTNLGMLYRTSSEKAVYYYTLAAGFGITDNLGSFIELFSEIFSESTPFYSFGAGMTYLLLSNLQVDISAGTGLFNNSKVWYFGTGISIRIPR